VELGIYVLGCVELGFLRNPVTRAAGCADAKVARHQ